MTTPTDRPLRRDAERNRQRILEAARLEFAERGLGVTMDDIARRAGVGVGTVYRRFPDKEVLIDGLFEDRLTDLAALAQAGLAHERPWEGLVHFLERSMELQCADRGLKELLFDPSHGHERVAKARERVAPLVFALVDRAQESGDLRQDVAGPDFPLVQIMVGTIIDATRDVEPEVWRRFLGIVLDGLRVRRDGPTPLSVEALDIEQVERAMRAWRPPAR
jgi:AcrR family transcriptional regulator